MSATTATHPAGVGTDRVGLADTVSQTMTLAWRATMPGIISGR